jgi:hypothetical protein
MMTPLSHLLPPLPGFTTLSRTYAPFPVWSGSTTAPVRSLRQSTSILIPVL